MRESMKPSFIAPPSRWKASRIRAISIDIAIAISSLFFFFFFVIVAVPEDEFPASLSSRRVCQRVNDAARRLLGSLVSHALASQRLLCARESSSLGTEVISCCSLGRGYRLDRVPEEHGGAQERRGAVQPEVSR